MTASLVVLAIFFAFSAIAWVLSKLLAEWWDD